MARDLFLLRLVLGLTVLIYAGPAHGAQTAMTAAASPATGVPRRIALGGALKDRTGHPLSGVVGLRLALYKDQEAGTPLWTEIQNVQLDDQGRYSIQLGASSGEGLPLELFTAGETRWLGVEALVSGEEEQPRLLLVSVPYALKAADADTLGGKPATAYMLLPEGGGGTKSSSGMTANAASSTKAAGSGGALVNALTESTTSEPDAHLVLLTAPVNGNYPKIQFGPDTGTVIGLGGNYLGTPLTSDGHPDGNMVFRNDTGDNFLFGFNGFENVRIQRDGKVGIGTTNPAATLDVNGTVNAGGLNLATPAAWGNWPKVQFGPVGNTVVGLGGNFLGTGTANDGNMVLRNDAGSNILFGFSGFEKMRIRSDGNVGIGMTNPLARLDVNGTVRGTVFFGNGSGVTNVTASDVNCSGCINGGQIADAGVTSAKIASWTATNTASGTSAFISNTNGVQNTADGAQSLFSNTTGSLNTSIGYHALHSNTAGAQNTAVGVMALSSNTQGCCNTAIGVGALNNNNGTDSAFATGSANTAVGFTALNLNTSGSGNTAMGESALLNIPLGSNNAAFGTRAGLNLTSGSNNTFLGYKADQPPNMPQLNNATAIGANAVVAASNALVLGDSSVSVGIGTSAPVNKLQVVGDIRVGTSGNNGCIQAFDGSPVAGTCSSDARLKKNVEPFSAVLDGVVQLRPVFYDWQADEHPEYHFGPGRTSGLIAQEVEKVFPEMVAVDDRGYKAVNYSQLPLLLLQAVKELKAQSDTREIHLLETMKEQQAQIQELLTVVQALRTRLEQRPE